MDWILSRAKAWVGGLVPVVAYAIIKYVETTTGFDIPAEIEAAIIGGITLKAVHDTPNKATP